MSIPTDRPAYRILSVYGFYGPDDHLYGEGDQIVFDGVPNEEMEPLNDLAHDRLLAYIKQLDDLSKVAAEKLGRPFIERPKNLDGAYVIASELAKQEMQIMGNRNKETGIEKVEASEIPEVGSANPKRQRGRPRKETSLAI